MKYYVFIYICWKNDPILHFWANFYSELKRPDNLFNRYKNTKNLKPAF